MENWHNHNFFLIILYLPSTRAERFRCQSVRCRAEIRRAPRASQRGLCIPGTALSGGETTGRTESANVWRTTRVTDRRHL